MIPFTKNTKEARIFLESEGYRPLKFYMGKEYLYPCITNWANSNSNWTEKDYSTFNMGDKQNGFYENKESSLEDFKIKLKKYESNKEA